MWQSAVCYVVTISIVRLIKGNKTRPCFKCSNCVIIHSQKNMPTKKRAKSHGDTCTNWWYLKPVSFKSQHQSLFNWSKNRRNFDKMKHIKSIIFAAVCLAGWIPEAFGGSVRSDINYYFLYFLKIIRLMA